MSTRPSPHSRTFTAFRSNRDKYNELGFRLCTYCGMHLNVEAFNANPGASDGLQSYCKPCNTVRRHHISVERISEMFLTQGGVCALCEKEKRLVIDHDHACCPEDASRCGNCVRGLLCYSCNIWLGKFENKLGIKVTHYLGGTP